MNVTRMLASLEGVATGDAFGETLASEFTEPGEFRAAVSARTLPALPWYWTDDTAMALGICEVLLRRGGTMRDGNQQSLALAFAEDERRFGTRQYSRTTVELLRRFRESASEGDCSWRALAQGVNSLGNGAAMRVAPLGAFFAGEPMSRVVEEASLSAEVTHSHVEATCGAVAVAVAAAYVGSSGTASTPEGLLAEVLEHTPSGVVRSATEQVCRSVPFEAGSAGVAAGMVGGGEKATCPDTVPLAIWCCCTSLAQRLSLDSAAWMIADGAGCKGDLDTIGAMVLGVLANARPVDDPSSGWQPWLSMRESLMVRHWDDLSPLPWPLGPPKTVCSWGRWRKAEELLKSEKRLFAES